MMRISGIFPRNSCYRQQRRSAGFTLLELLLVLAILGLMAGLALPRMVTLYESFQWVNERDEVLRSIAELGLTASRMGRGFELKRYPVVKGTAKGTYLPLTLPAGWQLTTTKPVRYWANGFCGGGEVQLFYKNKVLNIILSPPFCRPEGY